MNDKTTDRRGVIGKLRSMTDEELKAHFDERMKDQQDYINEMGKPSTIFARKIARIGAEARRRADED